MTDKADELISVISKKTRFLKNEDLKVTL